MLATLLRRCATRTHPISTLLLGVAGLLALLCLPVQADGHEAVSADTAATAVAQGASVVDVRSASVYATGHLPGAAHLPQGAATLPVAQLEHLISGTGIDLSRTVLVVGEPGDANAQALWHTLSQYASGRVLWLVGGALEWQLRGYVLSTQISSLPALPQHLVPHYTQRSQVRMAGETLRLGSMPATQVQLSLSAK
jgi:3-mercaptopyruvate sulfurtransferase SseA